MDDYQRLPLNHLQMGIQDERLNELTARHRRTLAAIDAVISEALPDFPIEVVATLDGVKELARQLSIAREKLHESD